MLPSRASWISQFRLHEMPFPMIQGTLITNGDREYFDLQNPYPNATVVSSPLQERLIREFNVNMQFDMTPFRFGAWDGAVSGITPMEWTGTRLHKGIPVNSSAFIRGFDKARWAKHILVFSFLAGMFPDSLRGRLQEPSAFGISQMNLMAR